MKRIDSSSRQRHRRGAALVVVLLVVLLILGVAGSLFRLSIIQHGQSRRFELQSQADWLARAGADRALARLADPDFAGDTWTVELDDLGSVDVVTRLLVSETNPPIRRIESHVRLAPEFARTPVHGHSTRTIGPAPTPNKDTP